MCGLLWWLSLTLQIHAEEYWIYVKKTIGAALALHCSIPVKIYYLNIYLLMKYKNTLRYLMSLEKLFIKRDCTPSLMKPATALTRRVSRILLLLQCLLVWRLTGSSVWPVIPPWLAVVPIFRDRGRVQWNKLWETYFVNLYKYSTMDTM